MGEWVGTNYYGHKVDCPQCRRNMVKQFYENHKPGIMSWNLKTKCECLWCGLIWEIPSIVKDSDYEQPNLFANARTFAWEGAECETFEII